MAELRKHEMQNACKCLLVECRWVMYLSSQILFITESSLQPIQYFRYSKTTVIQDIPSALQNYYKNDRLIRAVIAFINIYLQDVNIAAGH